MKAVLVFEMPESCFDCPCESEYICGVAQKELFYEEDRKPDWCPLKEMPKRKGLFAEMHEYDTDIHYEIGWNDCLEEIER